MDKPAAGGEQPTPTTPRLPGLLDTGQQADLLIHAGQLSDWARVKLSHPKIIPRKPKVVRGVTGKTVCNVYSGLRLLLYHNIPSERLCPTQNLKPVALELNEILVADPPAGLDTGQHPGGFLARATATVRRLLGLTAGASAASWEYMPDYQPLPTIGVGTLVKNRLRLIVDGQAGVAHLHKIDPNRPGTATGASPTPPARNP